MHLMTLSPRNNEAGERWSRDTGQNGGLAEVASGFDYAANCCSHACVPWADNGRMNALGFAAFPPADNQQFVVGPMWCADGDRTLQENLVHSVFDCQWVGTGILYCQRSTTLRVKRPFFNPRQTELTS